MQVTSKKLEVTEEQVDSTLVKKISFSENSQLQKKEPVRKIASGISGLGISISALTNKKEELIEEKEDSIEELSESFTPLELLNHWKQFADSLEEEHHLKNTMLNCLPDIIETNKFEVVVNNPVQEQRLLENAGRIMQQLRSELKNTKILMTVRVSIENEKKLGFTSLEKYNLMVEQNETLKKLKDEFGLELM